MNRHKVFRPDEMEEHGDDLPLNELPSVGKRVENWPPSDWLRHTTVENWNKGHFGVHAHFITLHRVAQLDAGQYCARFEFPSESLFAHQVCVGADRRREAR